MNNPYLLLLAIPALAAVIVFFILLPKAKKRSWKNIFSFIMHIIICVSLCLGISDIQYLDNTSNVELYILADCSASEENTIDAMDELIEDVYNSVDKKTTKIGIVAFGQNQETLVKLGGKFTTLNDIYDETKYPDFDRNGTDLMNALLYTNALYSEHVVRRMILISDGEETDNEAVDAISDLIENEVNIDCILVNEEEGDEVAITGLDYVSHCFVNREQTLTVSIRSRNEQNVTVELTSEGNLIADKTISANRGLNIVEFSLPTSTAGSFDYEVTIDGSSDFYDENNSMSFTQEFTDDFNVLFIGSTEKELDNLKALDLFTDKTNIDAYYGDNVIYAPYTLDELIEYDEYIISDTNILETDYPEEFAKNINTAVSVYGKSLFTFGATYTETSLYDSISLYNDLLPVQYKSDEGRAIVFLIDVSGSMSTDDRLTRAKRGLQTCLDILPESDFISIITFSSDVEVIQSLTSVKNKASIKSKISKITSGGGTYMSNGLTEAYNQIRDSTSDSKNIIVLSDGVPSDKSSLPTKVRTYASDDVVFSFINISNTSTSAVSLLENLATLGNGNYYYCRTAADLVTLMQKTIIGDIGNVLVETETSIIYQKDDDASLEGINRNLPEIDSYYFCRMKGEATTVLALQYKDESEDVTTTVTVPLYAYWTFGKGTVASFTSSLTYDSSDTFRTSSYGKLFFQNAFKQTMPSQKIRTVIDFSYSNNGNTTDVIVGLNNNDKAGKVKIAVTDPNGETLEYDLIYVSQNFKVTISSGIIGKYDVQITYTPSSSGSSDVVYDDSFYFSYSKEYDCFTDEENETLIALSDELNGTLSEMEVNYETLNTEIQYQSYKSLMVPLLITSVVLFLADIFLRKSDFKFLRKKFAK